VSSSIWFTFWSNPLHLQVVRNKDAASPGVTHFPQLNPCYKKEGVFFLNKPIQNTFLYIYFLVLLLSRLNFATNPHYSVLMTVFFPFYAKIAELALSGQTWISEGSLEDYIMYVYLFLKGKFQYQCIIKK
jgi:hypothetical protein